MTGKTPMTVMVEDDEDDVTVDRENESDGSVTVNLDEDDDPKQTPADDDDDGHEGSEDERVALRSQRREDRQKTRERRRQAQVLKDRDISNLTSLVADLSKKVHAADLRIAEDEHDRVNNAIRAAEAARERAKFAIRKATEAADGAAMEQAMTDLSEADRAITNLTMYREEAKKKLETIKVEAEKISKAPEVHKEPPAGANGSGEPDQRQMTAIRNSNIFCTRHPWYNPFGKDEDSVLLREIDAEVAQDGFDPATKDYWQELERRVKEEIPHQFDSKAQSEEPKPRKEAPAQRGGVGRGGGNDGAGEFTLPKSHVDALKQAGLWDDPVKRKKMIKIYRDQEVQKRKNQA